MSINELALFGGQSTWFDQDLCVNRPVIGDRQAYLQRVNHILDSHILTNGGPQVREFEKKLAEYLQVKHCITTCNGTMALQLIMHALNLQGEVIVPSFTFIATAHAALWQGLKPIFCDIDKNSHLIDVDACESLITDKTTAILGVHLWGRACEHNDLQSLASKYDLKLIYDAAHAFGSKYNGTMVGNLGDAEAFSFHSTKVFHSFEGGAVTTNSDEIALKIRRLRNFGFVDYDCVDGLGINAKMSEVCAAMGVVNLEGFGEFLNRNKRIYEQYKSQLKQIKGLTLLPLGESEDNNFQYIVIEIDQQQTGLSRDEMVKILHAERVMARRYFYPGCHRMQPYINMPDCAPQELVNTEALCNNVMILPGGPSMTLKAVNQIGELLNFIIEHAPSIRQAFDDKGYMSASPHALR